MRAIIDPCVVPADGGPRAGSPLLARSVEALTATAVPPRNTSECLKALATEVWNFTV